MRLEYTVGLLLVALVGCGGPSSSPSAQSNEGTTPIDFTAQSKPIDDNVGELLKAAALAESESRFSEAVEVWREIRTILVARHGENHWQIANCDRTIIEDGQLARLGPDKTSVLEQLRVLEGRTTKLVRRGDLRQALDCIDQARPLAQQVLGDVNGLSFRLQLMAGQLAEQLEDWNQAQQEFEQASVLAQQLWSPPHPDLETVDFHWGVVARQAGRLDESIQLLRQALAMTESLDGRNAAYASCAHELGVSLHRAARFDEALSQFETAEQIRRASLSDSHPLVADSLLNQSIVLADLQKWEGAETKLTAAEQICGDNQVPTSLQQELCLQRATLLVVQKNFAGAAVPLRQALDSIEQDSGRYTPRYAHVAYRLAMCLGFQKDFDQAEPLFRHALSVQNSMLGANAAATQKTAQALAMLLQRTDRPAEAQTLLKQFTYTATDATPIKTQ